MVTVAYATEAEGIAYFAGRLDSASWDSATSDRRTRALLTASRAIDRLSFAGDKNVASQANEFPRGTNTTVPQDIKDAACELAFSLLDGRDVDAEIDASAISSSSTGDASVDSKDFTLEHVRAGIPSSVAWALLKPYFRDPNGVVVVRT